MRDRRKEELEEHVRNGHEAARKAARLAAGKPLESDSESEDDEGDDDGGSTGDVVGRSADTARQLVDREEQYVDEDRFTTVTVQEMNLDAAPASEAEDGDGQGAQEEDGAKEKKKWPKKPNEKKKKFRLGGPPSLSSLANRVVCTGI